MVSDGESTNRSYRIPVGIRENDSAIFIPGTVVNFGLRMLVVKHVCISNDLKLLTLSLKVGIFKNYFANYCTNFILPDKSIENISIFPFYHKKLSKLN